jgi:cytochrome c553
MDIHEVFYLIVAIAAFFILFAVLVIPFFGNVYEYGGATAPCVKDSSCTASSTNINNPYCLSTGALTSCTNCHNASGYSSFLSGCSKLVAYNNNTHCYACTDFGYKSNVNAIILFTFFIFVIAAVILIITKHLPKFGK